MGSEHPINQPISSIVVSQGGDGYNAHCIAVGSDGVTRIEATTKSGMHADIPYVRVWTDDNCVAEFCQHSIVAVYFEVPHD